MPHVTFTQNLQRHLSAPPSVVEGSTVRQALDHVFAANPKLRGYILDDQGHVRKHVMVFVDGAVLADRAGLSDAVGPSSEVVVMQALSGG